MVEFLHHMVCKKPDVNAGIDYQPQLVSRIYEPSTVNQEFFHGNSHVEYAACYFCCRQHHEK